MPAPSQLGRISGPLLKANLLRDGVDLAFETDLLYLNVTDNRIGINTAAPEYDLDVNGTTRSTNLIVETQLDVAEFTITESSITSSNNIIDFRAAIGEAVVYNSKLIIDDFQIVNNVISTETPDTSIDIAPNGTGNIQLQSNTVISGDLTVEGNISATGDIRIGGNIIIGDASTDTITINASIQSDLIPAADVTYDLGDPSYRWKDIYSENFYTSTLNVPSLLIGDLSFSTNTLTTAGQDILISGSGTGKVIIGNFSFVGSIITNLVPDAISEITQSGNGYLKIAGTNGFVPPVGNDTDRPTAYAVVGMTRYNTQTRALEVWDGSTWASPAGTLGAVSETQANDIAASFALMLG
jgi:cytoskeletal protein CcmA (bactofilin family)